MSIFSKLINVVVSVETNAAVFAMLCRSCNDLRFLKQFN